MKKIAIVHSKYNGHQVAGDRAYWMAQTVAERMNAIEFLRAQYPDYENQLSAGLQRVCRIIRKK